MSIMVGKCWATVFDAVQTFTQHWIKAFCSLSTRLRQAVYDTLMPILSVNDIKASQQTPDKALMLAQHLVFAVNIV